MPKTPPLTYTNDAGEEGVLTGKAPVPGTVGAPVGRSWVDRQHPDRKIIVEDEGRMRASYVATRRALSRYLVPHRFEGGDRADPSRLLRARLGFGVRLNASYLADLMGHVRGAAATRTWGPLDPEAEGGTTGDPVGGMAKDVWDDATRDGVPWRVLFGRKVLEWMLSSLGGFLVVDNVAVKAATEQEEKDAGKRPYLRFVPWSGLQDFGTGDTGLRWVLIREVQDKRQPRQAEEEGLELVYLLYELGDDGRTTATRVDAKGQSVGEPVTWADPFVDPNGRAILPLVDVKFGEHPELPYAGAGLLMGLEDVVLDLFNVISETRESFRDAGFSMVVHRGNGYEQVKQALADGSRLVSLGAGVDQALERLNGQAAEVESGMALVNLLLTLWAYGAKRKAAEAMERAEAASGVSRKAEFQLDSRPLLVEIAEALDAIETNAMYLVAQMAGHQVAALEDVAVQRDTTFQMEDEASRIARLVREFTQEAGLELAPELKVQAAMRWAEASGLASLDDVVEDADNPEGGEITVRDLLLEEFRELAENGRRAGIQASGIPAAFPGFGQ